MTKFEGKLTASVIIKYTYVEQVTSEQFNFKTAVKYSNISMIKSELMEGLSRTTIDDK